MTDHPQIAVSTVIFALRETDDQALPALWMPLVRRIRAPFEGHWALPGGPLGIDESLSEAARHNLKATTGLAPRYLEQLYAFGDPARSGDQRLVSIVYWALVGNDEASRSEADDNVCWFPADALPALAFDHQLIVDYALWRLRNKVEYAQIAHRLLGETFTLAQLRSVYEAILQRPLDPANFRRQMAASKSLAATGEMQSGARHRPPRLYRYVEVPGTTPNPWA
ncbi:NUDIX hydrolase [Halotalea alkalilenta]|uniref:ADP-ribose pyrophosphatase n=1 Tax=Halotalea alkalilenta TaxID=376489 RepID=A0A172YB70_9GAMM|nr:NUDIX domain-containing protein [Halotalea alkalilenta]ANF56467.1 ADP-ribose pyrophosphatase [Halotalea alkalilenta]